MLGASAGAVAGLGLAAGMRLTPSRVAESAQTVSGQTYSAYGDHQAGIITPTPSAGMLIAYTLHDDVDRAALGRLMRVWSTDIAAMMDGRPAAGDTLPDMAMPGVSLSVLVGFGPRIFDIPGLEQHRPAGFQEIPPMAHDQLEEEWSGGDLLTWISADDFTTVAYVARRLTHDVEPWADVHWTQQGSWRGIGPGGIPATGRNLFGQKDGTGNPTDELQAETVWSSDGWLAGGTQLVVRRIAMDLPEWDQLTRNQMEQTVGRDLADGAPLSGGDEFTPMDFEARRPDGELAIAEDAHARLAHPDMNRGRRMHRRGLNYADHTGTGLIFCAFQADIAKQFIPVQRVLDDFDALNEWTIAKGSAVFAIPRGMRDGGWLAQELLD